MEKGFYHPSRGYWQTTGTPPPVVRNSYPSGTIEVPLRPSGDHEWNGSQWVSSPQPDPVPASITFRQLLVGAQAAGWISETEALSWAARQSLPTIVVNVIASLPEHQRTAARITSLTMSVAERGNALMAAAAAVALPDATPADRDAVVDALFRAWDQI